jgi:hypothetical protein
VAALDPGARQRTAVPLLDQVALSGSPSPSRRESIAAGRMGEGKGLLLEDRLFCRATFLLSCSHDVYLPKCVGALARDSLSLPLLNLAFRSSLTCTH